MGRLVESTEGSENVHTMGMRNMEIGTPEKRTELASDEPGSAKHHLESGASHKKGELAHDWDGDHAIHWHEESSETENWVVHYPNEREKSSDAGDLENEVDDALSKYRKGELHSTLNARTSGEKMT